MSITEKDIKDFENKEKKEIYDAVLDLISTQTQYTGSIQEAGKYLNIDTNLPNIGITFNNKLIELSQQFKEAGISMFVEFNEEYDYIDTSFVGDGIINYMTSKLQKGLEALEDYNNKAMEVANKKEKEVTAFNNLKPIKKLFLRIRSVFSNKPMLSLACSQQEAEEIKVLLSKYRELNEELYNYNLESDIVQTMVYHIKQMKYSDGIKPTLIKQAIEPTFKKLNLEHLVPKIKEELSEKKKETTLKDNKSWDVSNWGIDAEKFREETAKIPQTNSQTKESKQTNELTEK